MPRNVLVAFGGMFVGIFVTANLAWSSGLNAMGFAEDFSQGLAPQHIKEIPQKRFPPDQLLSLDEALARAMQLNPGLKVYSRETEARNYEAQQAGFLPNPELSVEVENIAGSGPFSGTDSAETTVLLSQRIELGGKRDKRLGLGLIDKKLAEQEHLAARAELTVRTTQQFVAVLAAQQRLALTEEQTELANKVLETVSERIAAGKTAQIERLRFQALLVEARLRTAKARRALETAKNALAALWNQPQADFAEVQGDLKKLPVLPDQVELAALLRQSPKLAIEQATVRKADQNLALEQSLRIPDLTLSFGGKNFEESNDHALVVGVSISLPVFDRNQGGLAAARARQAKAHASARSAELLLLNRLDDIIQRYESAYLEAETLRNELLPAVRQSFEAVAYGYQVGKFGYLDVLDAERALFEARDRYIESLAACHQAYAELEPCLGETMNTSQNETAAAVAEQRGQS